MKTYMLLYKGNKTDIAVFDPFDEEMVVRGINIDISRHPERAGNEEEYEVQLD